MVNVGNEEPATVVANLRKALAEIDELSAERASIEEALKEERNRDNILPKLMANSGRSDNIFTEELKKYDELKVISQSPYMRLTCQRKHPRRPVPKGSQRFCWVIQRLPTLKTMPCCIVFCACSKHALWPAQGQ